MRVLADSHAHLGGVAEELGEGALRDVLAAYASAWAAAAAEGGRGPILVDVGTESRDIASRAERLARAWAAAPPFLALTAGAWPSEEALGDPTRALRDLESAVADFAAAGGRCAAIGEGGLDYHHMNGSRAAQLGLFEGQLDLAARLGLPLVVHSREAFEDTLGAIASARPAVPVVIHCFGYGPAEARAFLDLGCMISFAGNLSYKKAGALREACALVPADRLLLETDSPYMNPEPRRGRPSSPLDLERTCAAAAALRGAEPAALAVAASRNAWSVFGPRLRP